MRTSAVNSSLYPAAWPKAASKLQGKWAHGGVSCRRRRDVRPPSVLIRWVLFACLLWLPELAFAQLRPVESTLAHELVQLERQFRAVPDETTIRLDRIISDATDAAVAVNPDPRTREEALSVLGAIQVAMAKHNLVQPLQEKDWPQTLGIALTPLEITPEEREHILQGQASADWMTYADPSASLFYVDCDMGAQIFMAVGERAGWTIRLAEVPSHNFVRWHLPSGETVNWDWTYWTSYDDDTYRLRISPEYDSRLQAHYIRSFTRAEARAYYRGLIASKADRNVERTELVFVESLQAFPSHPVILNNMAWFYATYPDLPPELRKRALRFALNAWSLKPDDANVTDTAGCSAAAAGQWELAGAIQARAVALSPGVPSYSRNLKRIQENQLCAR